MSGAVWATVAGVGFGLFQSVNRQAVRGAITIIGMGLILAGVYVTVGVGARPCRLRGIAGGELARLAARARETAAC
jgi:hypothetical protein